MYVIVPDLEELGPKQSQQFVALLPSISWKIGSFEMDWVLNILTYNVQDLEELGPV